MAAASKQELIRLSNPISSQACIKAISCAQRYRKYHQINRIQEKLILIKTNKIIRIYLHKLIRIKVVDILLDVTPSLMIMTLTVVLLAESVGLLQALLSKLNQQVLSRSSQSPLEIMV